VPILKNIHAQVETAIEKYSLDMYKWHICETTHCRAGWVVTLAGEPGKKLEEQASTLFAAMQIYKKSSPIKVLSSRFFDSNDDAKKDIIRCANLERKLL